MKSIKALDKAWANGKTLFWADPDPIEGNDYEITSIPDLTGYDTDTPILIEYNHGDSEAEVPLHEILIAK
tara:strand:+ start:1133 stop:1342 length:210 start_codon:yes stop_codon:yes gene_type:complete